VASSLASAPAPFASSAAAFAIGWGDRVGFSRVGGSVVCVGCSLVLRWN